MSHWPEPYPSLQAALWRHLRGSRPDGMPPLPTVAPVDAQRPGADPFWANAFAAYLARVLEWRYLSASVLATAEPQEDDIAPIAAADADGRAPTVYDSNVDRGQPISAAEPHGRPSADTSTSATSDAIFPAEPETLEEASTISIDRPVPVNETNGGPADGLDAAPPPLNTPAAATASARINATASAEELDIASTLLIAALEQVPRDVRSMREVADVLERLDALKENPQRQFADEVFIKRLFALSEKLGRYSMVLRNLEPVSEALLQALAAMPGVDVESDPEVVHVPSAAKVGTQTRILRPGIRDNTGKQVVKPVVAVSSREVSESREQFEYFPILADAFEELASRVTKDAYSWLRKAPELIDSHAGGDPASERAEKILRDCVRFANELSYYYSVPEYETLRSGVEKVVDELSGLLRDHHGMRIFPSIAQPYRDGRPAPAPFPQTVLREVPDPSEAGTLLRICQRGSIRAGKVEDDPIVMVSMGDRFSHLARAFRLIGIESRRLDMSNFKAWKAFVDRCDDLILQWVDARGEDPKKESLALRYLVNHIDEVVVEPGHRLKEASDRIVDYLRETFDIRPMHVRVGQRLDDGVDPNSYDFERRPGSGQPSQMVLQIKRRAFKDANNLLLQKGLLVVS